MSCIGFCEPKVIKLFNTLNVLEIVAKVPCSAYARVIFTILRSLDYSMNPTTLSVTVEAGCKYRSYPIYERSNVRARDVLCIFTFELGREGLSRVV
jgi:hypothetical protein